MPGRDGPSRAILGGVPALTERTAVRFAVFGRTLRLACAATDLPLLREQWSRCLAPEVTRPEPDARPEWDVIEPRETRPYLINALEMLRNKRDENPPKKHGNIPL